MLSWLLLLFNKLQRDRNDEPLLIHLISGFVLIFATFFIFSLRLETRIDSRGVTARFNPFKFFTKHYYWKDIDNIFVRKYSPIAEYGGWGVRGLGKAKAYNIKGNNGIQIVTKNKKSFLIGTQQPEVARRIINYYRDRQLDQNS
ncbi:hypothetical protein LZ575_07780 [Antarcticibacterium sp. 1MA-6-2]|uniref:hypothetical protein n=1 Tax=Antarcticibacterium sp. 1MA-6-2 TaxID=2908210 RepID=UPI001F1769C0|nr:hypothetical protein [Antarcticibacterium sp. 1MA-6-2]UJH92407.1 hypothetical protein LZ575_07780 [Antarcticibacterium sp. 1MA-6-2]